MDASQSQHPSTLIPLHAWLQPIAHALETKIGDCQAEHTGQNLIGAIVQNDNFKHTKASDWEIWEEWEGGERKIEVSQLDSKLWQVWLLGSCL